MHFAKRLQANESGLKRNDKICKIKRSSISIMPECNKYFVDLTEEEKRMFIKK